MRDGNLQQSFKAICKRDQLMFSHTQSVMLWTICRMLKAHVPLPQGMLTWVQVISVPAKGKTMGKARARTKENLKLESVLIVKNSILPKTATFLIADPSQVKNARTTPARAILVTSPPSIGNLHTSWKSWQPWWRGQKQEAKIQSVGRAAPSSRFF